MLKAVLVGLNQVDPSAYNGWDGKIGCAGCEKDVDAIKNIVAPIGYDIATLKTAQATRSAILGALETAATDLNAGDTLVFYFSGHGGQQPDATGGDEADGQDETLIAYDGRLIDDQLNTVWLKFRAGVRIFMLSDSCNSGTNYRGLRNIRFQDATPMRPLSARATVMEAQLIHLGGCRDSATSAGYDSGGAFTQALVSCWDKGNFKSNYSVFRDAIASKLGSTQVPQYNEYGPVDGSFKCQKPFMASGWGFLLQTGSALHPTGNDFAFAIASNGDLFAIKKSGTGTNSTEVHVLAAETRYQSFKLQTGTALHETDETFEFLLASNRDLYAIKRNKTGTNSTEVHVLSAASNYSKFVKQTGTALHETDSTFAFALLANRDLVAIKRSSTGTHSTEVHVLSAASNYKKFILQTGTALHETDNSFAFALASNGDIFAIKKSATDTKSTEVHVLQASAKYSRFCTQVGTVLHPTDDTWAFGVTLSRELFGIKKSNTGTGKTEVHIVDLPPWQR